MPKIQASNPSPWAMSSCGERSGVRSYCGDRELSLTMPSQKPSQMPGQFAPFITRSVSQFSRLDRAFQRHEFRDLNPFKALNHSGLNFNGFALGRPFCR
jgi:hypothetical protein